MVLPFFSFCYSSSTMAINLFCMCVFFFYFVDIIVCTSSSLFVSTPLTRMCLKRSFKSPLLQRIATIARATTTFIFYFFYLMDCKSFGAFLYVSLYRELVNDPQFRVYGFFFKCALFSLTCEGAHTWLAFHWLDECATLFSGRNYSYSFLKRFFLWWTRYIYF